MAEEIFERSLELSGNQAASISEKVSAWWKDVSKESQTLATPGKLYAVGNYIVTLVKNSLSDGPPRVDEGASRGG